MMFNILCWSFGTSLITAFLLSIIGMSYNWRTVAHISSTYLFVSLGLIITALLVGYTNHMISTQCDILDRIEQGE